MIRRQADEFRKGFRLIDLLVASGLAICFMSLLVTHVVVQDPLEKLNRAASQYNLKLITLAAINNSDQNNGDMPGVSTNTLSPNGGVEGSIFYVILPQMDQDKLFKEGKGAKNTYKSTAGKVPTSVVKALYAPGDPTADAKKPWTSYIANLQAFPSYDISAMQSPNRFPASIADGVAQTIAFTEAHAQTSDKPRLWYDPKAPISTEGKDLFEDMPAKLKAKAALSQSYYKSGISVSLFDGSVRTVKPGVSVETWKAAFTPDAGDKLGKDW